MKVKELRNWLNDFGEKHKKQHYRRSNRCDQKQKQNPNLEMLMIQSKPSNASTSPSSSIGSVSSQEDTYSVSCRTMTIGNKDNDGEIQDKDDSYYSDPSFLLWSDEESSTEEGLIDKDDSGHDNFRRKTFGGIQGMNTIAYDEATSSFHKRASLTTGGTKPNIEKKEESSYKPVLRKKVNPKDLKFLHPESKPKPSFQQERSKSTVSSAIEKFGGPGVRKSRIEKRKDELQRLFSETRTGTHVKKVKWFVCPKTGVYKKKLVIEVEYN